MRSPSTTVYAVSKIRNVPVGLAMLFMLTTAACGSATEDVGNESSAANGASAIVVDAGEPIPPLDGSVSPPSDAGYPTDGSIVYPPDASEPPTQAWRRLLGAWTAVGGDPIITSIVFEDAVDGSGHAYFADLAATAPTATSKGSVRRVTGSYTASLNYVFLEGGITGSYEFQFIGANLVATSVDGRVLEFTRGESFCDTAADCAGQDLTHVACVGEYTCAAHTCDWLCGGPVKGDPCGDNTCNFGERCCNPLLGICTPAGIVCEQ
jgi:hypothetical protein